MYSAKEKDWLKEITFIVGINLSFTPYFKFVKQFDQVILAGISRLGTKKQN